MDQRTERLNLTDEQWSGLLNASGPWLGMCCGSISAAREVLVASLRRDGEFWADNARAILCEIGDHEGSPNEGLRGILNGQPGTMFWAKEGSPWFEIARACRALLGEGDIIAAAKAHRMKERAKQARIVSERTAAHAEHLATKFHDTWRRLAPEHTREPLAENFRPLTAAVMAELLNNDVIETFRAAPAGRPHVVVLCGSTRFREAFVEANQRETFEGRIVLSVGVFGHADAVPLTPEQNAALDALHKQKIDMADEVLVLNVGGYIGASTRSEIVYARSLGKRVRYLEEPEH